MTGTAKRGRESTIEPALVWGIAILYVLPLALTRYFPGLDLPWHAATISVLHRHDAQAVTRDFLGYLEVDFQFSSYLTMYVIVDALAHVVRDVAVAMQVAIAAYVVFFVVSCRRLVRSFGRPGFIAVFAAPAAYSQTMQFGFFAYALAYPMTFWLWAHVRAVSASRNPLRQQWKQLLGIAGLSLAVAVTHPFAAVLAVLGAIVIALVSSERCRALQAASIVGAVAVGLVPAVIAAARAGHEGAKTTRAIERSMSLWDRITTQQFTSPVESVTHAPERLFGFVETPWAVGYLVTAVVVCLALRLRGRAIDTRGAIDRLPGWLLAIFVLAYFVTPYSFEWPHKWYNVQPRLLPLIWALALVVLAPATRDTWPRWRVPAVGAVPAAMFIVLAFGTFVPFAREAADFRAVLRHAEAVPTLGLIEQRVVGDRQPPDPWRVATPYVIVEHGGFCSHLPMIHPSGGNAGAIVPVRLAQDAPPLPRQPRPPPRSFDWGRDGQGWGQFLIRDRDPDDRFDYFRQSASKVQLVATAGRWRLFRARVGQPIEGP